MHRLTVARSASKVKPILPELTREVAELYRRLESGGQHFDRKSVYRPASDAPLQTLNMPLVGAVCEELQVELQLLISLAPPPPKMARMDAVTQDRLDELMGRNTESGLTAKERNELERLVQEAERLSLGNARLLAGHGKKSKTAAVPRPARSRRTGMTVGLRLRIEQRAGGRCEYCQAPAFICAYTFHLEHCLPKASGGKSGESNLAISCASCNFRKSSHTHAMDPVTGEL